VAAAVSIAAEPVAFCGPARQMRARYLPARAKEAAMTSPDTAAHPNELLTPWYVDRDLPDFSRLEATHFAPALDEAMAAHLAEIDALTANPAAPTFANTIEQLERAGLAFTRNAAVFWILASADTTPALQELERALSPKFAAHFDKITSNRALFDRVEAVWTARDTAGLDDEQLRVLERTYENFVRSGANLEGDDRARMSAIKQRLAELGTTFSQNVLADEAGFMLELKDDADLSGLPEGLIQAMAAAAEERDTDAPYVVTLSRSLIEPFLMFSERRDLREKAYAAWISRGDNGTKTDNNEIIAETLSLRKEFADLLDFATYADYRLANTMAETPENVRELLEAVWPHAVKRAGEERKSLEAAARAAGQNIEIEGWDWRYWAERVRRQNYNLDETEVKNYLSLDAVIAAAFAVANRLFGLTFERRGDIKAYHPDVRAFAVNNRDGKTIGLFLGDYFARPSKRSGAWMTAFRGQHHLDGETTPIILNVMNFAKPAPGKAALLSFDDARTLFHEFGHALHGLLSDVTYPSLSGTSVERDFVELPSQLYEHWLYEPAILKEFARHHETGEAMPDALIDKLKAAENFNQGFQTVEYLACALVDMALHSPAYDSCETPATFEKRILTDIHMPREIAMRHRPPHFLHVFAGSGYAAGYYSYMWSEVLDADAFQAFLDEGDIFATKTAEKLHRFIYGAGGKRRGRDAYIAFRGQLPSVEGLLRQRGLADVA
jgi:peptidyl-dipeptidase Dcp